VIGGDGAAQGLTVRLRLSELYTERPPQRVDFLAAKRIALRAVLFGDAAFTLRRADKGVGPRDNQIKLCQATYVLTPLCGSAAYSERDAPKGDLFVWTERSKWARFHVKTSARKNQPAHPSRGVARIQWIDRVELLDRCCSGRARFARSKIEGAARAAPLRRARAYPHLGIPSMRSLACATFAGENSPGNLSTAASSDRSTSPIVANFASPL
jgi:hypothetical protein